MIRSLQALPVDALLLILSKLTVREQLQLTLLNRFFYSLASESIFEKVIIVFSNYKPIDYTHYIYKYHGHTIFKSSPYILQLLVSKLAYIKRVLIFDNINGLITNWNHPSFHHLTTKSHIQQCFSVRSLSKIDSNIKTLELNLINKGSILGTETALKYSSVKFLRRIENLILLTNNFNRLFKFQRLLSLSLPAGDKLQLKSLAVQTYAGIGTHQENYYFVGSTNMRQQNFQMLNFNSVINLSNLSSLELGIRHDKSENGSYWHYHFFKFFFSFFNDYNCIMSNNQSVEIANSLFASSLTHDFGLYEEYESFCQYYLDADRDFQLKFPNLKKLSISINSCTDNSLILSFVKSIMLKNPQINHLSLRCSSSYTRNQLFSIHRHSWFCRFYNEVTPQLVYFDDRFFIDNFLMSDVSFAETAQLKMKQIYKEVTGLHILNFSSINVLLMLLDNYNRMKLTKQFVTSISSFENILPLSHDETVANDYQYESYIVHLSPYKRRKIILKFVQLLKNFMLKDNIFNPVTLDASLVLHLNNIPFNLRDGELCCTL